MDLTELVCMDGCDVIWNRGREQTSTFTSTGISTGRFLLAGSGPTLPRRTARTDIMDSMYPSITPGPRYGAYGSSFPDISQETSEVSKALGQPDGKREAGAASNRISSRVALNRRIV
jgi:hypothetical protein